MFGLPLDKLLSISVSVVNDNPLHDFDDPIYKVDIERTVSKIDDFFWYNIKTRVEQP